MNHKNKDDDDKKNGDKYVEDEKKLKNGDDEEEKLKDRDNNEKKVGDRDGDEYRKQRDVDDGNSKARTVTMVALKEKGDDEDG